VQRLVGAQNRVVNTKQSALFAKPFLKSAQVLEILLSRTLRLDDELLTGFEVFELGEIREREIRFGRIENLEEHQVVAAKREVLQPFDDLVQVIEKVGYHHRKPAPTVTFCEFVQGFAHGR